MASAAAEQMDIDEQKIDEGLYSRQLYVLISFAVLARKLTRALFL